MLTRIDKHGVSSSDGFQIESSVDGSAMVYREGARAVIVRVEDCFTGKWPGVKIAPNAFAHWDNLPTTTNSPTKQAQMRANFIAALLFQGIAVEL